MPDIGYYHPIFAHFVVALLVVGVLFRLLSLIKKFSVLNVPAFLLILIGTLASVGSVKSGTDAHGAAERIPGARSIVQEHEEWGERTRNAFLGVLGLEVVGLFTRRRKYGPAVLALCAVAGLGGLFVLYEAAEHGGELVYAYAGGVGTRTGEESDVSHLLLAGLYQQAQVDRREGRSAEAAELYATMVKRFPDDPSIRLAQVDSLLRDSNSPERAIAELSMLEINPEDRRLVMQSGLLMAQAQKALGNLEAARATLQDLASKFPGNRRIEQRLKELH